MKRASLLAALLALVPSAGAVVCGAGLQPGQSRSDSAREELARATALKQALRGQRGRERAELRERAVAAYRAIRAAFPDQPATGAEAAFRAGELLRADGLREAARLEFLAAWELGGATPFRARAGLELGHIARRRGFPAEALEAYRRVLDAPDSAASQRDQAALWAGRSNLELGREDEARRLFEGLARTAEDPSDRVQGHDELGLLWIAAGDLEAAAGELARCRAALRERSLEETPLGERVRGALESMRSVDRLREAIARRRAGVVVER